MIQRITVLCLFIALVTALSCSDRDTICECDPPAAEEPEFGESVEDSIVRANCYILRDAVEAFAMDNIGEYPQLVEGDYIFNPYGIRFYSKELKDYLPDGRFLWNPYTWWRLEPTTTLASAPGEIGYRPIFYDEFCVGYCITGYGQDSIIVELSDTLSMEEQSMIVNCRLLRDALESYASDNFDEYTSSVTCARNDSGKVLIDYFPNGERLQNPYTLEFTEPSSYFPEQLNNPGEISLRTVFEGGFYIGYEIYGYGDDAVKFKVSKTLTPEDSKVLANCYAARWAAERFAAENAGVYPSNVSIDTTPLGNTMVDYFVNSQLLINPYYFMRTEPVDGAAATTGQTGYQPVVQNLINTGYTITGVGKHAGETIFTLHRSLY